MVFERQVSADHCIQNDTAAPDVSSQSEVLLALNHFWGRVARTSAGRLQPLAVFVQVAEAEVDDFDVVVMVEQKILWLQVSVHDAQLVDVLDARDDLLVHLCGLLLLQVAILNDVLEQLAARTVLHDQVQVVIVFYHFIQLNDVRMPNLLQNRDFAVDALDV